MLQGCLNGPRAMGFHPALPCTPAELARDAAAAIRAGAGELHVHPRDERGDESLQPDHVAAALVAIRNSVPGIPVGLSTHWDVAPGGIARQEPIRRWTVLPDYVSVNLVEDDAPDIIALVLGKGIGVEAGLWSAADAERFVALPDARRCLRVLVEINEQDAEEGLRVAADVIGVLGRAGLKLPILLHGFEATVWPIYRDALTRGLDGRIGLEDGDLLPSGSRGADNADLLSAAAALAREARRSRTS